MIYTVIAYKESFSTRCGDFYNSDLEFESFDNTEEAIDYASNYYYEGYKNSDNTYDITVLYDGKKRWMHWDDDANLPDIEDPARELASTKHDSYIERIKEEQQKAEDYRKELKRKQDLELFAKLKAQYGE